MKIKKSKILLFGIPLLMASIAMITTSCSLFNFGNPNDNTNNKPNVLPNGNDVNNSSNNPLLSTDYEKINHMQFISERSFSLKFISNQSNNVGYGTGWIFAKDNSKQESYYIATNLHVASFIANGGKQLYEPSFNRNLNNYQYKNITNVKYNEIHFGQMFTMNQSNNIVAGTTMLNGNLNDTIYNQKVNINDVSIAYTTFNMFNQMKLFNEYNIYNDNFINNATQDLAVLKIDFSKRQYINPFGILNKNDTIKKSLDAYDRNPTRFANSYNFSKDKITVAGFPANQGSGKWTSSLNNISTNNPFVGLSMNRSGWHDYISQNIPISEIKEKYALLNNIPYVANGYASQINVSLQALFNNLNLEGGSSGSMAINEKNEVIGIYWGGYTLSNNSMLGGVDLFKNNNIYNRNNQIVLNKYDTLFDFKTKVLNSNIL